MLCSLTVSLFHYYSDWSVYCVESLIKRFPMSSLHVSSSGYMPGRVINLSPCLQITVWLEGKKLLWLERSNSMSQQAHLLITSALQAKQGRQKSRTENKFTALMLSGSTENKKHKGWTKRREMSDWQRDAFPVRFFLLQSITIIIVLWRHLVRMVSNICI